MGRTGDQIATRLAAASARTSGSPTYGSTAAQRQEARQGAVNQHDRQAWNIGVAVTRAWVQRNRPTVSAPSRPELHNTDRRLLFLCHGVCVPAGPRVS